MKNPGDCASRKASPKANPNGNRCRTTLLVWGHSSGKVGGGDSDLTHALLSFAKRKSFRLLGAFPKGPRIAVNAKSCYEHVCHRGALFPIIYESCLSYALYWVFATEQVIQTHRFIKKAKPDGILFFSTALLLPVLWSFTYPTKRYLFVRELIRPDWLRRFLFRFIYRRLDIIFAVSTFLKDELEKQQLSTPVHVIYSVPVIMNKSTKNRERNRMFRIGCVGAISKIKGQHKLVQACHTLRQNDNLELHFYGAVPTHTTGSRYYNKILTFQRKRRLKTALFFNGSRDHEELINELATLDLIAIPSEMEGLSLVLLESILLRVPVIASRVGEMKRILKHEYNGLLFEPNDIAEIANCIDRLRSDEELYNKIRSNLGSLPSFLGRRDENLESLADFIENDLIR